MNVEWILLGWPESEERTCTFVGPPDQLSPSVVPPRCGFLAQVQLYLPDVGHVLPVYACSLSAHQVVPDGL